MKKIFFMTFLMALYVFPSSSNAENIQNFQESLLDSGKEITAADLKRMEAIAQSKIKDLQNFDYSEYEKNFLKENPMIHDEYYEMKSKVQKLVSELSKKSAGLSEEDKAKLIPDFLKKQKLIANEFANNIAKKMRKQ